MQYKIFWFLTGLPELYGLACLLWTIHFKFNIHIMMWTVFDLTATSLQVQMGSVWQAGKDSLLCTYSMQIKGILFHWPPDFVGPYTSQQMLPTGKQGTQDTHSLSHRQCYLEGLGTWCFVLILDFWISRQWLHLLPFGHHNSSVLTQFQS